MTSIKDVAREVGVSTATVSRALRGLPRVAEGTRQRVLSVAERLDYVASPHAASLASGHTRAVGVVVPFVTRWFFSLGRAGAEELLREKGYDLLLYNLAGDREARHRVFMTHLLQKRVDAVLVLSLTPTEEEKEHSPGWTGRSPSSAPACRTGPASGSTTWRRPGRRCSTWSTSGTSGSATSAARSRTSSTSPPLWTGSAATGPRWRGPACELCPGWEVVGDFTVRGGLAATRLLLDAEARPTAVFAASDEMAIGCVHAVREAGLRVPEDISVIGVDDHEMAEFFDLTTVAQPVHEQGRLAAELLLQAIRGGSAYEPMSVTVPTRLIVRSTTGPPPATS